MRQRKEGTRLKPEAGDGVLQAVGAGGPLGAVDDAAHGEGVLGQGPSQGGCRLRPPMDVEEFLHKGGLLGSDGGGRGQVGEGEVHVPQGAPEVLRRSSRQDVQCVVPQRASEYAQPQPEAPKDRRYQRLSQEQDGVGDGVRGAEWEGVCPLMAVRPPKRAPPLACPAFRPTQANAVLPLLPWFPAIPTSGFVISGSVGSMVCKAELPALRRWRGGGVRGSRLSWVSRFLRPGGSEGQCAGLYWVTDKSEGPERGAREGGQIGQRVTRRC